MALEALVPVHIVTGFLGSGKTTLIHQLIEQKPTHEKWAILVNEFGQIGIDQTMFAARDDVVVKGLPGGCLCCQLAFVLQAALVNLLARQKPDRVIIEPSGLGHPAGLMDLLQGEAFQDVVAVQDIIATLDPRRLDEARVRAHETFQDQLTMADVVVITLADMASDEQHARAEQFIDTLWPPRKWVHSTQQGPLPIDRLLSPSAPALRRQPPCPPRTRPGHQRPQPRRGILRSPSAPRQGAAAVRQRSGLHQHRRALAPRRAFRPGPFGAMDKRATCHRQGEGRLSHRRWLEAAQPRRRHPARGCQCLATRLPAGSDYP